MTPWLIDIPQTRTAPEEIRRRLRLLDPTTEVLYLGWSTWYVGKVRPTQDTWRIAMRMLARYWAMPAKHRATPRGVRRYHFALACLQGFRPVAQYTLRDLDGRVVREFAESQYHWLHARGDLLEDAWRADDEAREKNRDLFRDEYAAKDVLDYGRTSNFGYAVSSVRSSQPAPVPSGRSRILSIPA